MTTSRISHLFDTVWFESAERCQLCIAVLTAACTSVKEVVAGTRQHISMTHRSASISIDDLIAALPPRTNGRLQYSVSEVISALREMSSKGYIDLDDSDFSYIKLTDELFSDMARATADALDIEERMRDINDSPIYASSIERAEAIRAVRARRFLELMEIDIV